MKWMQIDLIRGTKKCMWTRNHSSGFPAFFKSHLDHCFSLQIPLFIMIYLCMTLILHSMQKEAKAHYHLLSLRIGTMYNLCYEGCKSQHSSCGSLKGLHTFQTVAKSRCKVAMKRVQILMQPMPGWGDSSGPRFLMPSRTDYGAALLVKGRS